MVKKKFDEGSRGLIEVKQYGAAFSLRNFRQIIFVKLPLPNTKVILNCTFCAYCLQQVTTYIAAAIQHSTNAKED